MAHTNHADDDDFVQANSAQTRTTAATAVLLAKLGIDSSRIVPFLAGEGRPAPAIATLLEQERELIAPDAERPETTESSLAGRSESAPTPSISRFGDWRAAIDSRIPSAPDPIDPAHGMNSLMYNNSSAAPTVTGLDRVLTAAYDPIPTRADGFTATVADDYSAPPILGGATASTRINPPRFDFDLFSETTTVDLTMDSAAGGTDLEARLRRAVDRLEQIAELLEQTAPTARAGPVRAFLGRVDV